MDCEFVVGQKVVCVYDHFYTEDCEILGISGFQLPALGEILVIRDILLDEIFQSPSLLFEGLTNPLHPYFKCEFGFTPRAFRPLVEKKTDISVFQKVLIKLDETLETV